MGDLEIRQMSAQLYAETEAVFTREKGSGNGRISPIDSCIPLLLERIQPVASGYTVAPSQGIPIQD